MGCSTPTTPRAASWSAAAPTGSAPSSWTPNRLNGAWVKPEDKLGLEAAPTWVVDFDVAGDALPEGQDLIQALLLTKLMTGAVALGCAQASLDHAAQYATEREAFGKPIGAFQGISFKIADMAIAVDAARVSLWRSAWHIDRGTATLADVAEANGQCLAAAVLCGDDGVHVLGGHGFVTDHPSEMWFRDAVTLFVSDAPEVVGDVMVSRSVFPSQRSSRRSRQDKMVGS